MGLFRAIQTYVLVIPLNKFIFKFKTDEISRKMKSHMILDSSTLSIDLGITYYYYGYFFHC